MDIDVSSTFSNNVYRILALFEKYDIYKEILTEQKKKIEQEGFDFLNSDEYADLVKKQRSVESKIIEELNNRHLNKTYKTFVEDLDYRENFMLNTIYAYSKEYNYNRAVFLIGAGHRRSIIQKVEEYQLNEKMKLNWTYYSKV